MVSWSWYISRLFISAGLNLLGLGLSETMAPLPEATDGLTTVPTPEPDIKTEGLGKTSAKGGASGRDDEAGIGAGVIGLEKGILADGDDAPVNPAAEPVDPEASVNPAVASVDPVAMSVDTDAASVDPGPIDGEELDEGPGVGLKKTSFSSS